MKSVLARRREGQRSRNAVYRHGLHESRSHHLRSRASTACIPALLPAPLTFQPSTVASICLLVQVWEVGLAFILDKIASICVVMLTALAVNVKEH